MRQCTRLFLAMSKYCMRANTNLKIKCYIIDVDKLVRIG